MTWRGSTGRVKSSKGKGLPFVIQRTLNGGYFSDVIKFYCVLIILNTFEEKIRIYVTPSINEEGRDM